MGENSGIQWTDDTFNPWVGCVKISPGCDHCYAESYDKRVGGVPVKQRKDPKVAESRWGAGGVRNRTKEPWTNALKWNAKAQALKTRRRVFCASLCDVFEDNARFPLHEWRADLFALIAKTPWLDWQLLTKRPGNILRHLARAQANLEHDVDYDAPGARDLGNAIDMLNEWRAGRPPKNVWVGTTVENQEEADRRIPELLKVPAVVRFLSTEPLLEAIDLEYPEALYPGGPVYCCDGRECGCYGRPVDPPLVYGIDWLIIGGESGAGARPFNPEWARSLIKTARSYGGSAPTYKIAPFVKQLGRRPVGLELKDSAGGDMAEWPLDLRVREFPR